MNIGTPLRNRSNLNVTAIYIGTSFVLQQHVHVIHLGIKNGLFPVSLHELENEWEVYEPKPQPRYEPSYYYEPTQASYRTYPDTVYS